uniref:Uncharacterized protein n=1 Tax=Rhizophora mucronata TaxID=61149 RepID=A0A2P2P6X8_RHIMU
MKKGSNNGKNGWCNSTLCNLKSPTVNDIPN